MIMSASIRVIIKGLCESTLPGRGGEVEVWW